jgi:DNA-directed RNA polymerase subunit RPC12/RpoP
MSVSTLGEAMNAGWRITMRCAWGNRDGLKSRRECVYIQDLDMATLVATRGRDFPLASLDTRLRCPRCGSRRILVMFHVPPNRIRAFAAE